MTLQKDTRATGSAPVPQYPGYFVVQDDVWDTPLPNGLLRWFGFDFDRVEIPQEPLLNGGDPPRWIGEPPGFVYRCPLADGRAVIEIDEFDETELDDDMESLEATPRYYRVLISAHGMYVDQAFACRSWQEVRARCRRAQHALDESYDERHQNCVDGEGRSTADACDQCSLIP